jgi:hypothetical protein
MKQIVRISVLMLGILGAFASASADGIPIEKGTNRPPQLTMPGR